MSLLKKQQKFSRMVVKLLSHAHILGYEITFGDAFRDSRCNYGHKNSLHRKRLAVDLNLFQDGKYLTDGTGHDELHRYWSFIGGADRIDGDLNHYSVEHEGMR